MEQEEFNERVSKLAGDEIDAKHWGCFYLSWAEEGKWLGGAFVFGYGPVTARLRCQQHGINPGGECMILRCPSDYPVPPPEYRNRLLTREELMTLDPDSATLEELRKETP